ncbi:sugar kinase [Sediminispirochaeta bajacaliforniensis]|uniref:sugar kinase n=1 Tax=Sediminispirochaeta bajacaliforniensis TaxID=148 RepID=UPI00036737E0|nr:sugar kinase [Sediminispirochaeta bajacaliforniensis]
MFDQKATSTADARVVTLGEIMLRLTSPGHTRLLQTPFLEASFGGGEANVAVSLASFGLDAAFFTALPEGPLGDAAVGELRRRGVDTSAIIRQGERIGIYFLETGANQRASNVLYDRSGSAIALLRREEVDLSALFAGASWFHITGITPAISETAAALSIAAVRTAKEMGLTVSCDLNFRKKLWKYGKSAPQVMGELLPYVDIAVANEEDCQHSLGIGLDIDVSSGGLEVDRYRDLASLVLGRYPNLSKLAITLREARSADSNGWSALLATRGDIYMSRRYEIRDIVDRVGGGDAFAAGLIYGLLCFDDEQEALEFAVAAGCLKHSVSGDLNLVSRQEVLRLMSGDGSGRVRR